MKHCSKNEGWFRVLILTCALSVLPGNAEQESEAAGTSKESELHHACLISDTQTVPINVELAISSSERQTGLMERDALDENAGMLFVYDEPRPPSHTFWMYKTRIPLDIAFIGPEGTIRAIRSMVPCTTGANSCPTYPAGVSFTRALEMNLGFFRANGIGVGDRFVRSAHGECQ